MSFTDQVINGQYEVLTNAERIDALPDGYLTERCLRAAPGLGLSAREVTSSFHLIKLEVARRPEAASSPHISKAVPVILIER